MKNKTARIIKNFASNSLRGNLNRLSFFMPGGKGLLATLLILFLFSNAYAEILTASWYSVESLKKEGTYKHSKGVMANGDLFSDTGFTCANRIYALGTMLRVTNIKSGKSVIVRTTDRIGIRFANSRIDLSRLAFSKLDKLEKGIISVKVEVIHE